MRQVTLSDESDPTEEAHTADVKFGNQNFQNAITDMVDLQHEPFTFVWADEVAVEVQGNAYHYNDKIFRFNSVAVPSRAKKASRTRIVRTAAAPGT